MGRSGQRYCEDCGLALPGWCDSCGAEVTHGKAFCGQCGHRTGDRGIALVVETPFLIPRPSEGMWEERRLATVLFCDLVGFTPLAERLETEQVRSLQMSYFERMSTEIERFGGVIEKFAGDAILALFGVPVARGDDAERAVVCAVTMLNAMHTFGGEVEERWDVQLNLRIGINTGDTVSGVVTAGGREDYSVTGDVVNTAARLQTVAEPGSIMVGAETMRLARKRVRFGERRELVVKGKAQPVAAYQVLSLRERSGPGEQNAGYRSPLIGRAAEYGMLKHAWERAGDGHGQIVSVTGEAGVGKSRLVEETIGLASGADVVAVGRCVSHGTDISFGLLADLWRSILNVSDGTEERVVEDALRAAVDRWIPAEAGEARAIAHDLLGEILGLRESRSALSGAGAQARRQGLVRVLRLLLAGMSSVGPALLVLEDLQWCDAASVEVLRDVLEGVPGLRMLVLAAYRPGWTPPWSEWSWIERLQLRPLVHAESAALAASLLGGALSPTLDSYIAERAGGNPFFVEELVLALQEAEAVESSAGTVGLVTDAARQLPSTLTELLLARLDGLTPAARSLAQTASVIGRNFSLDLLASIAGSPPPALRAPLRELMQVEIFVPWAGAETEYAFRHVTTRDVAYHTLVQARRQNLHAAAAGALLTLHPGDEPVELIAYHFGQTEDHRDASVWLERAADRAADMFDNQTSIAQYEEARRRLERAGGDQIRTAEIAEKLGRVFAVVTWYDEALEELENAAGLYRALDDVEGELRTVAEMGRVHFLRGAAAVAVQTLQAALAPLDVDDETSVSRGLVRLYMALVDPLYSLNRFEDALTAGWRALELARAAGDQGLIARATVGYGLALHGIGRLDEARSVLEDAVPLAEATGDLAGLAEALTRTGDIYVTQGRPDRGREYYERALEVEERRGSTAGTSALLSRVGDAAFMLGDWAAAGTHFEQSVDLARSVSFSYFSAWVAMRLGEHCLYCGDHERGLRFIEESLTIATRSGQTHQLRYLQVTPAAWDLFEGRAEEALQRLAPLLDKPVFETTIDHRAMQIAAEAYVALGDPRAESLVSSGLAQAEGQGNHLARLHWLQTAALLAATEDRDAAQNSLRDALALARTMPHVFAEATTLYRRGAILQGEGGQHDLEVALAMFLRLGARPFAKRVELDIITLTEDRTGLLVQPATAP